VFTWLTHWLGSKPPPASPPPPAGDQRLIELERQLQDLRLTVQERDAQITRLQADLDRLRKDEAAHLAAALQQEREKLIGEAAGPVAQLWTQAHLLESENKPIQARDVLTIARRLVRLLEERGLELVGSVGEQAGFDPGRHVPLAGEAPAAGRPIRVRFVGVAVGGKVVRKAGVEVADAGTTGR
jgi:molecular chaperone GrpE (heat shock protein)